MNSPSCCQLKAEAADSQDALCEWRSVSSWQSGATEACSCVAWTARQAALWVTVLTVYDCARF